MSKRSRNLLWSTTGALLPTATRAAIGLYRPFLAPLGLTHPQFLVLLVLDDGQPRTATEIGQQLALRAATMTPILKRLEFLDYISRSRDRTNERRLAVTLSDNGLALIPQLRAVRERVNQAVGLTSAERQHLQDFIASTHDAEATQGRAHVADREAAS